jgi:hypothetical protein
MSMTTSTSTINEGLDTYLQDLEKVIQWLLKSEEVLLQHGEIGNDVNTVKQQFQVHEVWSLVSAC